jgi:hypothetical protein
VSFGLYPRVERERLLRFERNLWSLATAITQRTQTRPQKIEKPDIATGSAAIGIAEGKFLQYIKPYMYFDVRRDPETATKWQVVAVFCSTFRSLHAKTNSLPYNLAIPCYKYSTCSSGHSSKPGNASCMRNEMKVRCASSRHVCHCLLTASAGYSTYTAPTASETAHGARQRRDVASVDVSESGSTFLPQAELEMATPFPSVQLRTKLWQITKLG